MKCKYCSSTCIKAGRQKNGIQRYQCRTCRKYQQSEYSYNACKKDTVRMIFICCKESCGIRSIARILSISKNTVSRKILALSRKIKKPEIIKGKVYEMDELRTYIKNKNRLYWIAYALRRDTGEVVDFKVGRRNSKTLNSVTETLILSEARKVYTDGLNLYKNLLPQSIHQVSRFQTNRIERKNLSMRTHLKRLGRKTICFSRSQYMLEACLKIYFWS